MRAIVARIRGRIKIQMSLFDRSYIFVIFIFRAVLVGVGAGRHHAPAIPCIRRYFWFSAFFTSAGLWLLLEAEFLAITLVLVYVGAVMVLFLFVVMMLDINLDQLREGFWKWFPFGAFLALADGGRDGHGADGQTIRPR